MTSRVVGNNDVCDLGLIYNNDGYSYSLPQNVLETFLSGKAFDNPSLYTDDELSGLKEDINAIFQKVISSDPTKNSCAVITAGSPGSGKTFLLKKDLQKNISETNIRYAYVCPDDVCLKGQERTYQADIRMGDGSVQARQDSYNKWRPGSNAAAHVILANLIREKCDLYFGTTSSSPLTANFFEFLKQQGYKIKILHISAPDNVRWLSIQERDQDFVQTTEQDTKEKGLLIPQRINDTFLKYADNIEFYYREAVSQDAVLAARWSKNEKPAERECIGTLQITNQRAYEDIKRLHNTILETVGKTDLFWEKTVEAVSQVVGK